MPKSEQPKNCRKETTRQQNSQENFNANNQTDSIAKHDPFPPFSSPVRNGGSEEERLEGEGAQFLVRGGGIRRDDAQREPITEERELLEAEGSAGDGAVERGGVAGDQLGGAVEGLRGGDAEVPEGRVHGGPQLRHAELWAAAGVECAFGCVADVLSSLSGSDRHALFFE